MTHFSALGHLYNDLHTSYTGTGLDTAYMAVGAIDTAAVTSSLSSHAIAIAASSPVTYSAKTDGAMATTVLGFAMSYTDASAVYILTGAQSAAYNASIAPSFATPGQGTPPLSYAFVNQSPSIASFTFLDSANQSYTGAMEAGEGYTFVYTPHTDLWTTLPGLYPMYKLATID